MYTFVWGSKDKHHSVPCKNYIGKDPHTIKKAGHNPNNYFNKYAK